MLFLDRYEAGRQLAEQLRHYAGRDDTTTLGLPRGGVPVGFEVARALGLPLDVFLVRKLGVPGQEELAMGAIASGGIRVLNPDVVQAYGIEMETIDAVTAAEFGELKRREHEYREGRPPLDIRGRTLILTDDGLATGSTMRAAVKALRGEKAGRIVVAVPVSAKEAYQALRAAADEIVCLETPESFMAVGDWYFDFRATSDAEVRDLLARAESERTSQYARNQ
jgi:putative phosphoribosyl transferase